MFERPCLSLVLAGNCDAIFHILLQLITAKARRNNGEKREVKRKKREGITAGGGAERRRAKKNQKEAFERERELGVRESLERGRAWNEETLGARAGGKRSRSRMTMQGVRINNSEGIDHVMAGKGKVRSLCVKGRRILKKAIHS